MTRLSILCREPVSKTCGAGVQAALNAQKRACEDSKQEGVELTSDFTAPINAELKVGPVELSMTVSTTSPVVDVQGIAQRTVMTRNVLDAMPTGRNIQAVGILIPGTNLAAGGGGAISRDDGGSGGLQQSPLIYRGSGDAVQTVEGMRLNNLCANGAYSGVYWNDGSLQEISYVTGADSVEMGQGGIRVSMVPRLRDLPPLETDHKNTKATGGRCRDLRRRDAGPSFRAPAAATEHEAAAVTHFGISAVLRRQSALQIGC